MLLTGSDLATVNSCGHTALHFAACRGDPEILQRMLEHGACVDARSTPSGCTPLMSAVMKAHLNRNSQNLQLTVEKLVAANCDLNAVDEQGNTALMLAVNCENQTVITELLNLDNILNCEMRRFRTSVSITLIEAGQTFCLCQMHWD